MIFKYILNIIKSLNSLNALYFIFKINTIKIKNYIIIINKFINRIKFLKFRENFKNLKIINNILNIYVITKLKREYYYYNKKYNNKNFI